MEIKSERHTEITYKLELTITQANWLRNVMQNPLREGGEDPVDAEMREAFFQAVTYPGE